MSDPKEQGRSQSVFYDLVLEVTQCHLVNVKGNKEATISGGQFGGWRPQRTLNKKL